MNYPEFKLHFLFVGDADCMVISYRQNAFSLRKIAVIDAGNIGDSQTIKDFLWDTYKTRRIDLAICTHPDKDHKGGFFGLFEDEAMEIVDFWYKDPWSVISVDDFEEDITEAVAIQVCRRVFNHPSEDGKNLIEIAEDKCTGVVKSIIDGDICDFMPLTVVGPSEEYYREVAIEMVSEFEEIVDDPDDDKYDEEALPNDEDAKSVIDEDDDPSATNKSSIMLLFNPGPRYLLLGDATCASIKEAMQHHNLTGCIVKVPHHGSKHNLTTEIIEDLKISQSVISAKGSKKHPNNAIVHWLSKSGNVYSTHKTKGLYYSSEPTIIGATPLRKKQS